MRTGLCPRAQEQRRYLWTDAFAVCNFLELFQRTSDQQYRRCAEKLIYQVHRVLGSRSVRAPGNSGSFKGSIHCDISAKNQTLSLPDLHG